MLHSRRFCVACVALVLHMCGSRLALVLKNNVEEDFKERYNVCKERVRKQMTEAVAKSCSAKKLFLKIATTHSPKIYQKETPAQVFSFEFCETFKNAYLTELRTTVSEIRNELKNEFEKHIYVHEASQEICFPRILNDFKN